MSRLSLTRVSRGLSGAESAGRATGGVFLIHTRTLSAKKITGRPAQDMDVLAVLNLGEFAQIFSKMGMFPVFDLAYYIVSILYLKYEPGEKSNQLNY